MTTSAPLGQVGGKDLKRFRDLGVEVLVLSLLCVLLVGGTQAELVSHVADIAAPTILAKPPVVAPVAVKPPVVAPVAVKPPVVAPVAVNPPAVVAAPVVVPPAAAKPAPVTAPAAVPVAVVPPPKTAPVVAPAVIPPAAAPVTIAPAHVPAAAAAPKVAPVSPLAAPGPVAAKPPVAPGPVVASAGNGSLDADQVGALRSLGMDVGLNACNEEPATVLTCDNNPVTQHLVTLSVQDCPPNATLTDLDFSYLSTVHLSHLSFMNCADVPAPSEPPKVLTTSLLDFFLMDSFTPMDAWWLGRLHALQNLTVLDVTVTSGSSGLDVILPNMDNLRYLMIQNATLSGTLPAAWPQNLNIISLSGNYLFGEIPVSLSKLKLLEVLDLSHNGLSGHLPSYVGNLQNLQTLYLNNNGFSGGIPKQFANLRALTKLDLSFNNLNGSIPEELGTLALTDLDLRNNTLLTGSIPFDTNALRNMKSLLVSGTSLCYDPTITSAKLASFLSVPLCGGIAPTIAPAYGPALGPSPSPAPAVAGGGHKKKPNVVAIVLSVLAVLVVLAGVVYCCCRWWGAREGYA